jgi:hypothetical protein
VADDQLAHPRPGRRSDALARYGAPLARRFVSLESPALVVGAMRRTDLSEMDVGPIAEPLEILSRSLQREAGLHALGRIAARDRLRGFLATRGRLADLARRRPEVVRQSIEPPIVLAGLPGTGATLLQRLLALDPGLRTLGDSEARSPLPAPASTGGPADARPAERLGDDMWLLAVGFGSMLFEAWWNVPAYAEWIDAADLHGAYGTMRDLLAVLQVDRAASRWVLTSPQHLERLVEITDVFPGATVVHTHGDPAALVPELAARIADRRRRDTFDVAPATIGRYWAWRTERLLARSIDQRAAIGTAVLDVRLADLLADPMAVVEDVYRAAGRPVADEVRRGVERHRAEVPPQRADAAVAPEDLGLDPADLRRRFADYCDRFDVRPGG